MTLKAGFAEVDITPPVGTHKIGWLKDIVSDSILDPLHARIAIFSSGNASVAFVQLDTLIIARRDVLSIREAVSRELGFPGCNVLVAATHNHAGPAVDDAGEVKRDEACAGAIVERVIDAFGRALAGMQEVELGFEHVYEWNVAFSRRVVMRDGTVCTHGSFRDSEALFFEGPIDPEVAVLAARAAGGELLGAIVNFACHPTHHGGDPAISAGYPGALADELRAAGCPVTLFLNGAAGNMHYADPRGIFPDRSKEEIGKLLAQDVKLALAKMQFTDSEGLESRSRTVALPFRPVTQDEVRGAVHGAQRFIDTAIYDRQIPALLARIAAEGTQRAEVQAITLGPCDFVGVPAEYFVEHGLRIKTECHPRHALVVGYANGHIGYVPTRAAFTRGGYETTFGPPSFLAPEAGDLLADAAIALVREG